MAQTFTNYESALKDVYGSGTLVRLLTDQTYLLDRIERKNVNDIGSWDGRGRKLVWASHVGRNRPRGFALNADGGQLAVAGQQKYISCQQEIYAFDAAIEFTDLVAAVSSGRSVNAFASAVTEEMDGGLRDMRQRMNRMAYGDGTGLLTMVGRSASSSSTVEIVDVSNIHPDDYVEFVTISDGRVVATATVVRVTPTGRADSSTQTYGQVELDTRVTVGVTEGVFLAGSYQAETEGLRSITGTSRTLHGVDSTRYPIWNGNVLQAGWTNVTEDLLMQQAQRINIRTGENIQQFVTTYGIQRRLANRFQNQRRWTNGSGLEIQGGYSTLMVSAGGGAVPLVADRDCPNGTVFALNMRPLAWAEVREPGWLEAPTGGGGILHLKDGTTPGTKQAAWQAWIVWYAALICSNPGRLGRIEQLKDDVPIPHD